MKLKEGIKKEDFLKTYFVVEKDWATGDLITSLLQKMGLTNQNYRGHRHTLVAINEHGIYGYSSSLPSKALDTYSKKYLSDLIEPEEEYPKYVRCIKGLKKGESTPIFIKDKIYKIWSGGLITDETQDNKVYAFYSVSFEPATEQEYLAQQSCIELEADLREPKEVDSLKIPKMSTVPKLNNISDLGIKTIFDYAKNKDSDAIILYLKEWFPNASCFKEAEKTYKIGDQFKGKEDGEVWQINMCHNVSTVICLNNYKGEILNCQAWVEDVSSITKQELEQIRPDLFEKMEYLG